MRSFRQIARLIREARIKHPKGYSQLELSQLLGYKNGQFISNVERALCSIPLKMLNRVAEILDIDHRELKEVLLRDYEETINNYLNVGGESTLGNDSMPGIGVNQSSIDQTSSPLL